MMVLSIGILCFRSLRMILLFMVLLKEEDEDRAILFAQRPIFEERECI